MIGKAWSLDAYSGLLLKLHLGKVERVGWTMNNSRTNIEKGSKRD